MEMLGNNQVPFARIFTKCDKISKAAEKKAVEEYDRIMLSAWESLPVTFLSSAANGKGRAEILALIQETINIFSNGQINRE